MFKLAESRASSRGLFCGVDGLFLGAVPLIERDVGGGYRVRPAAEIEALLGAAYATRRIRRVAARDCTEWPPICGTAILRWR